MMNPMLNQQLQQQWMAGVSLGQQGVAAEAAGNLPMAAHCYQQAAGLIQQSIFLASQCGIFVQDSAHAALANAHLSAARIKSAIGHATDAWQHVQIALMALNQAIAQNPRMPAYHSAAGAIMMAMGNLPEAERAFGAVQHLMPGEPQSLQMLQTLRSMRGPAAPVATFPGGGGWPTQHPQHNAAAPSGVPQAGPAGRDWVKTIKGVCDVANAIMGTVTKFETMAKQFG